MPERSYDHFPSTTIHYPEIFPDVEFTLTPEGNGWTARIVGIWHSPTGEKIPVKNKLVYRKHTKGPLGQMVGMVIRGDSHAAGELAKHMCMVSYTEQKEEWHGKDQGL